MVSERSEEHRTRLRAVAHRMLGSRPRQRRLELRSTIGRTSTAPPIRAAGMRYASSRAQSRLSAS